MQPEGGTGAGPSRSLLGVGAGVVVLAGLIYLLPFGESVDRVVSAGAVVAVWLLLQIAQVTALRRTGGVDRLVWAVMIATDVALIVLFASADTTDAFLPSREGLPIAFLVSPVATFQGLVVLVVLARRQLVGTDRLAFAMEALWMGVAVEAVLWTTIGEPVFAIDADALTVATILSQGILASALAGTFGALVLRSAPERRRDIVALGLGIVTLRATAVLFYRAWLGDGVTPGSGIDYAILVLSALMIWSAVRAPEAATRLRSREPGVAALLTTSWVPVAAVAISLAAQPGHDSHRNHALVVMGVSGAVLVLRLSIELRHSAMLRTRLHREATTDTLTELPNRAHLERAIDRSGDDLRAVIIIDLDRFKAVNDQLGHKVGDGVLREVAARVRLVLGEEWFLARVGGDEFVAITTAAVTGSTCRHLAEEVVTGLEPVVEIRRREAWIGASVGVATVAEGIESRELWNVADLALREAKLAGRGEVVVSDGSMRAKALDNDGIGRELEAAIDEGQLFCLYQPKIDLLSGDLTGVEALVRWDHPTRGVLVPAAFLDVAESNGLVARIDEAVLGMAATQLARWNELPGPRIRLATNMSAWQLARRDVDAQVTRVLASVEGSIDPTQVTIELTETLLIDDPDIVQRRLRKLASTGVRISVDDFGSGFTSVAHLRQFPITEVKIDRSLTNELTGDDDRPSVAGAVIALAQSLELEVVGEGVETVEQAAVLRRLGCRQAQGYLFAPPVAADQIDDWLTVPSPFAPLLGNGSSTPVHSS